MEVTRSVRADRHARQDASPTRDTGSSRIGGGMSVDTKVITAVAGRLRQAAETGVAIPPIRDELGDGGVAAAYAVQQANTDYHDKNGRRLVGRKIGLTSVSVQKQLGVDSPDFGMLFADMALYDGEEVKLGKVLQPKVEDPVVGCGVYRVVSTKRLKQHELAILRLLNLGMTNQEIANELAITVTATKWRVSQIFLKLDVRNRIEAAAHTRLQLGLSATEGELPPAGPMPERLREMEIAILRSVNLGMTTQEIASNLNLTAGTVKWRMSEIFGKLQVRNRIQALARARQREWL